MQNKSGLFSLLYLLNSVENFIRIISGLIFWISGVRNLISLKIVHLNFLFHFHVDLELNLSLLFSVILLTGWTTINSSYHLRVLEAQESGTRWIIKRADVRRLDGTKKSGKVGLF